jgi:hypothetical protein
MRRVNIRTGSNYAERIPVEADHKSLNLKSAQWKQKAAGQRLLSKRLVIVMAEKRVMPIFFPLAKSIKKSPLFNTLSPAGCQPRHPRVN